MDMRNGQILGMGPSDFDPTIWTHPLTRSSTRT